MKDCVITDFFNPMFQTAFQEYFKELEVKINNWDSLFDEMNKEKDNVAILRITEDNKVIGFILFKIEILKNWFFEEKVGFIREFWISREFRKKGHGSSLLNLAEKYFVKQEVYKSILTTDTAPNFYIKQNYMQDFSYSAKNKDLVFVKLLK